MSDHRPSDARRDDAARLLRGAARRRAVATADLFLPDQLRLTERERLTAHSLLARLVRTIEDELRATLADRFADEEAVQAAFASAHVEIAAPLFDGSHALEDRELVGLLLRRAEEHRIYRASGDRAEQLRALIAARDAAVAADAMAVLVARSRRLDRFQEPVFARTELPAELQHRLVWTVAAALRAYMIEVHRVEPARADAALAEAAAGLIAGYDEGDSLEARCNRLARALLAAGRLDGGVIVTTLMEGTLPLFIAGLSAAAGIGYAAVWDILTDPAGGGPVFLLRASGLSRQQAAEALIALAEQPDDDRLVAQIGLFDATDPSDAARALSLWSLDPAYREAVLRLSEAREAA
jgi:uncharacterized protein (DUF2336 family)